MAFLQKPARWMQLLASTTRPFSAGPNFAFELAVRRTSDEDMAGLDLGDVLSITSGANGYMPRRSGVSPSGSPVQPSGHRAAAVVWAGRGDGVRGLVGRPRPDGRLFRLREAVGRLRETLRKRGRGYRAGERRRTARLHRADRRPGDQDRESGRQGRGDLGARRQRRRRLLAQTRNSRSGPSVRGSSIHRPARRKGPGFGPEIWASCPTASSSSSAGSRMC